MRERRLLKVEFLVELNKREFTKGVRGIRPVVEKAIAQGALFSFSHATDVDIDKLSPTKAKYRIDLRFTEKGRAALQRLVDLGDGEKQLAYQYFLSTLLYGYHPNAIKKAASNNIAETDALRSAVKNIVKGLIVTEKEEVPKRIQITIYHSQLHKIENLRNWLFEFDFARKKHAKYLSVTKAIERLILVVDKAEGEEFIYLGEVLTRKYDGKPPKENTILYSWEHGQTTENK